MRSRASDPLGLAPAYRSFRFLVAITISAAYPATSSGMRTFAASALAARISSFDATGFSAGRSSPLTCRFMISSSSLRSGSPIESRSMNRSSCASGSGNVPAVSIGFCVAMTKNGSSSFRVVPSTVTCRSCMHSRSPDCVRGVARLISSASRIFVKTGPFRNSNSPVFCW